MKNKKNGFSLAEIVLTTFIVGVLAATAMPVIHSVKSSYTTSTYYVFKNLEAAVTKIMAGSPPPRVSGSDVQSNHKKSDIRTVDSKYFDNILYRCLKFDGTGYLTMIRGVNLPRTDEFRNPTTGSELTCKQVLDAYQSNAQSSEFCSALAALTNVKGTVSGNGTGTYTTSSSIKCAPNDLYDVDISTKSANNATNTFIKNINTNSPNFVAANGYRYYISKWARNTPGSDYGYRVVAVDMNGTKPPNRDRVLGTSGQLPDIVSFAVLDTGEIFPMGVAADDIIDNTNRIRVRYLPSEVKGYIFDTSKRNAAGVPEQCKYASTDKRFAGKCDYERTNVQTVTNGNFLKYKMTYRQAFCAATNETTGIFANYCSGMTKDDSCPSGAIKSSNADYDICKVEPIKPVFRFNPE